MKIKKKAKFITRVLAFFSLIVLAFFKSECLAINKFTYWANGIFERFVYSADESLPSYKLLNANNNAKNHFCVMPIIDYQDKNSKNYLKKDHDLLRPIFKICGDNQNFEKENSILTIKKILHHSPDITHVILDKILMKKEMGVLTDKLKCFSQKFDKKINVSEESQEAEYLDVVEFKETNATYEQSIQEAGYYYVFCEKTVFKKKVKIYENVLTVMNENLQNIFKKRLMYKQQMEDFKRKINMPNDEFRYDNIENTENCFKKQNEKIRTDHSNVLIIGIDSLSFNHFKRVFKKTYSFLNEELEENILFDHFNSIGGNTYPNVGYLNRLFHYFLKLISLNCKL